MEIIDGDYPRYHAPLGRGTSSFDPATYSRASHQEQRSMLASTPRYQSAPGAVRKHYQLSVVQGVGENFFSLSADGNPQELLRFDALKPYGVFETTASSGALMFGIKAGWPNLKSQIAIERTYFYGRRGEPEFTLSGLFGDVAGKSRPRRNLLAACDLGVGDGVGITLWGSNPKFDLPTFLKMEWIKAQYPNEPMPVKRYATENFPKVLKFDA